MGQKGMDFRHKEVINIKDGKKLGYDLNSGNITAIIVPGSSKPFNFFSDTGDIVIEWNKIKCIGENVILVDL